MIYYWLYTDLYFQRKYIYLIRKQVLAKTIMVHFESNYSPYYSI